MGENKIAYLDNMKIYPANSGTSLRSKKDILNHLLIEYALASIATYALYSSHELIRSFLKNLDDKYNISKLFNSREKELIIDIYNKKISKEELDIITYKFEKCNVFMWALGFIEDISFEKKCNVKNINDLLLNAKNINELLHMSNIIENHLLINYFSKISKVTLINDYIKSNIIDLQSEALDYILFYNPNRDGLRIIYEKDELRFEVLLPSNIIFEKINSKSHELFAFKNKNNSVKMVMEDLKNININDNVKSFEEKSYILVDVNSISSVYLERKIVKVKFEKEKTVINIYYMIINKHLIRLSSLDNNTNTDMDVILSIKMI